MMNSGHSAIASQQVRRTDRRDYRVLHALAVASFLFVSLVTRLLPRGLRPFARPDGRRESCLDEARRMASAVIPYAFEW